MDTPYNATAEMVEMRRAAVNYFEQHGYRCDVGEDCTNFATYTKTVRDYPMHSCDACIEEARGLDARAISKGGAARGQWQERDDAKVTRELETAVVQVGVAIKAAGLE